MENGIICEKFRLGVWVDKGYQGGGEFFEDSASPQKQSNHPLFTDEHNFNS